MTRIPVDNKFNLFHVVFQAGLNIVTMTAATRHFQCMFL